MPSLSSQEEAAVKTLGLKHHSTWTVDGSDISDDPTELKQLVMRYTQQLIIVRDQHRARTPSGMFQPAGHLNEHIHTHMHTHHHQ